MATAALGLSASCLSVQDYGKPSLPLDSNDGGALSPPIDSIGKDSPTTDGTRRWEWINPAPTGKTLTAIGGTSETDVWVAGEAGTVAHFDGARWDLRYAGPPDTTYFSIGTRQSNNVWIAGRAGNQIGVVHYDGKEWTNSYPFAGSNFHLFSHGTGARLFAVVDWDVLELTEGKWERTDTSANDVFGPPADLWVAPSGAAWMITTGAKLLHLPAGSRTWQLESPLAPSQAVGIAISGAGSQACAFYTGRPSGAGGGAGFVHYDGTTWQAGPAATNLLAIDTEPHGSTSACLADGTGILVEGDRIVTASLSSAPSGHLPSDFPGERLYGAMSLDGSRALAVGTLGAFMERTSGTTSWNERGPTTRNDIVGVDVGLDGAVMLVDALQPDRSSGGEVLFFDGALETRSTSGIAAPILPYGITVIDKDDAWVLSEVSGSAGVAHWTGTWGATRRLDGPSSLSGAEGLAIWAPAKDDVWITATEHCPTPLPSGACETKVAGYAWHYEGSAWKAVAVDAPYRSIHGTGPKDVWFAGDGVAHWDGTTLTRVPSLTTTFTGVWSSAPGRVWLWGESALLFDGQTSTPIQSALGAATDWDVRGIAESDGGDLFVLTKRATGTSLLWFDASRTKLLEQVTSALELTTIRGRGYELWAVGAGGASMRFSPTKPR